MSWKEIMKEDRIDAETMYFPRNRDLLTEAMRRLLGKHYSAPELEDALIDMMNKIDRS